MIICTEVGVTNIKKYSNLNIEERTKMRKGGNSKFMEYVGNVNLKFYSQQAVQYRFELALGLSEHYSDLSTNHISPQKSFIYIEEQKQRLHNLLELQGYQGDLEWIQIQYQILSRDIRKKIDLNSYLATLEKTAQRILNNQEIQKQNELKQKKQMYNQNDVFKSFSALLKQQKQ